MISFLAGMVLTAAIAGGMVAMGWMHISTLEAWEEQP